MISCLVVEQNLKKPAAAMNQFTVSCFNLTNNSLLKIERVLRKNQHCYVYNVILLDVNCIFIIDVPVDLPCQC